MSSPVFYEQTGGVNIFANVELSYSTGSNLPFLPTLMLTLYGSMGHEIQET